MVYFTGESREAPLWDVSLNRKRVYSSVKKTSSKDISLVNLEYIFPMSSISLTNQGSDQSDQY